MQSRVLVGMAVFATTQVLAALQSRTLMLWLALSAILVGTNWTVYIFAVNTGRVLESSLGAPGRSNRPARYALPLLSLGAQQALLIAETGR